MDKELKNHFIDKLIDKYASYLAVDDFKSIFEDLKVTINADLHNADVDNARGMFTVLYETAPECINDINPDMLWKFTRENKYLEEFKIPKHITNIANYAFINCSNLKRIEIPDSVISIEDGAFSNCTSLASIVIPPRVTSIDYAVFDFCNHLTSITIPSSVTSIGKAAFRYCRGLTSIEIPEGVISIESFAFSNCRSLTSIEIPSSVTSIGNFVFYGCKGLTVKTNNKYVIDYCKMYKINYQEEII